MEVRQLLIGFSQNDKRKKVRLRHLTSCEAFSKFARLPFVIL